MSPQPRAENSAWPKSAVGLVAITPLAPFTLADIYALRCFGTVGFVLGHATGGSESIESWASLITSPLSRNIFKTFTKGSIRYRLNFVGKGHQRSAVRLVANQAYAACPEILNDARSAPWTIDIHPAKEGGSLELSPRLTPDPRLYFRVQDVPAASHPPWPPAWPGSPEKGSMGWYGIPFAVPVWN